MTNLRRNLYRSERQNPRQLIRTIPILLILLSLACSLPTIGRPTPTAPGPSQTSVPPPLPTPTQQPLPPALVESDPPPGAEIPLQGPVRLYFNQAMDRSSVEAALESQPAEGRLDWENDATLVYTPGEPLPPESELTFEVSAQARSAQGLALSQPIRLTYRTAGYLRLSQVLPEPDASEVDPTSAVVATFNRPVVPLGADPQDLPPAFNLIAENGEVPSGRSEWLNTSTFIFYPDPALQGGMAYRVEIEPSLQGADGSPLESGSTWSFTTALPRLVSVEPAQSSRNVRLDADIVLTFNQPMDPATTEAAFNLIAPGTGPVPGELTWNETNTVLTFDPAELLSRSTIYTLALGNQAQGRGGTPIVAPLNTILQTVPSLAVRASEPLQGGVLEQHGSVKILFSAPLAEETIESSITISPTVPNLFPWWSEEEFSLFINGEFAPSTDYSLSISPTLTDAWGASLGQPYTLNFRTAPLPPGLTITSGTNVLFLTPQDPSLVAQATNISRVPLTVGSLPLEDFFSLLSPDGYARQQSYQPSNPATWEQSLALPADRTQAVNLYLSPDQSPLAPGLYFMRLNLGQQNANNVPYILVVSNVHLTFKISPTETLVWAVDLRTNTPLSEAPVRVYGQDGSLLAEGDTGPDGVMRASISGLKDPYSTAFAVLGEPGEATFSVAISDWSQGLQSWDFGLSSDLTPPRLKAYLYTDRPIYRPGQTVYFRAVVRQAYNGRYDMPDISSLPLTVYGDQGQELSSFEVGLSPFGTGHGQYTLADDAQPGYYRLSSPDLNYDSVYFQVANYRKPEIDLEVAFASEQVRAGEPLSATLNARYFFDAPAGNVDVHWVLYKEASFFHLPGYQVGVVDTRWMEAFFQPQLGAFGEVVAEGDARTNPDGSLVLDLPAAGSEGNPSQPVQRARYTLEATVQDESEFPVSTRASVEANPADFYIGLRPDTWVGRAGEQIGFDVQLVDWDQNPAGAVALRAEFMKVTWERQDPPPGTPSGAPTFTPQYTEIGSTDFVTSDQGQARLAFTPPEPGNYQLQVSGEGAYSEILLWVGGPGQVIWPNLANQRLHLTADRQAYQPGDTAQVFVPNPFGAPVTALMTLERSEVLRYELITIEAGGSTLSLPLSSEEAPNVYLSITLLGRTAEGRPDFRQGYLNLTVEPVEQTLIVSLASQPQRASPGDEVSFEILVTDSFGNPVQGEFSLSVVDMATLALADPNSPDIVSAFYGEQPLGIRTGISLAAYANRELAVYPGGGGGGGGESVPPVVREQFPDTAYWNAEIVTGPDGKARVSLALPDSLTTWQIETRGITADSKVGQAEDEVVTTKELLVRPVTPRFFVVDDHTRLAAIVQNNTTEALQVDVSLQGSGFSLDDPASATQQVSVPAGGRAQASWWGTVQDVEAVELIFSASSGNLQDATHPAQGVLPVLRYTTRQTFSTSGTLESAGERLELASLPRSFDPRGGNLNVELSPSLAAAILDALEALEHFPYECTEQTLSRFLPNLEAYRALQQFGVQSPALQDRLDRTLNEGLQRLFSRQNFDGGWSWWQGGENDPYVTAYVLFGLSRAREAGIAVPDNAIRAAVEYLRAGLPGVQMLSETWQFDRLAFEHFALVMASQGDQADPRDVSGTQELYQVRDQLSPWAQALLALTLERLSPGSSEARTLVSDLQSEAVRSASGAHWEIESDAAGAWRNMMTSLSNSAIVVYALAQRDPGSPLIADASRYLMAHRQADGAWSSTYASAWTLMALIEVMKGTGELSGDFSFSAILNGAQLASGQASGAQQLNPVTANVPLTNLHPEAPNALTIQREAGPGRLYYTAALNVSRPVESVAPLERGLSIARQYYASEDRSQAGGNAGCGSGGECVPIQSAQPGERVNVRVTLTLPNEAYYLVVEDYIPAGAEILDTSLKTSQQGEDGGPGAEVQFDPRNPFAEGWGWWNFHNAQVYDDHIAWSADYLPAGTYELTYTLVVLQPGEFRVMPARAWQFYFPEVQGNSAGAVFEIEP